MKISYIFGAQRQPTLRMILTLFLLMLGGLLLTNVTGALLMKVASFSTALKWTTVVQNLLAFVFPALVVGFMYVRKPMYYLGVANRPSLLAMAGVAAVYVLMTPAMNTLIAWNENWTLPAAFSELEIVLRSQEESARQMTEQQLAEAGTGAKRSVESEPVFRRKDAECQGLPDKCKCRGTDFQPVRIHAAADSQLRQTV